MPLPRFGEQRLVRDDVSAFHRTLYRVMGVPDPAHYLHFRYLERALDTIGGFAPGAILDAGCGGGDHSFYLARRFPGAQVLGIDLDAAAIHRCSESQKKLRVSNLRFEQADLTTIDYHEVFDLVVSIDVLEHIPMQQKALGNLARALRPAGWAYFHIPTKRPRPVPFSRWLSEFHEWAEHEHTADELTPEEFASRVHTSGLRVAHQWKTFAYWSGELATSLFALGFRNSALHRVGQAALAPACRVLAIADTLPASGQRYATGVLSQKPV